MSMIDAYRHLVGVYPDRVLAEHIGCDPANLHMYRVRRGIPRMTLSEFARQRLDDDMARRDSAPVADLDDYL